MKYLVNMTYLETGYRTNLGKFNNLLECQMAINRYYDKLYDLLRQHRLIAIPKTKARITRTK